MANRMHHKTAQWLAHLFGFSEVVVVGRRPSGHLVVVAAPRIR